MHTRVSEIGQKHPGSVKDCSSLSISPVSSARGHSRDSGHSSFSERYDSNCPLSRTRCDSLCGQMSERRDSTRTLGEEAVSDNSPSASKQRTQFPSPSLIQYGQLWFFTTSLRLTPVHANKNEKSALHNTVFNWWWTYLGKCWSYRLKKSILWRKRLIRDFRKWHYRREKASREREEDASASPVAVF